MAPKSKKRVATPPSTGKKKAKKQNGQPSIDSFFTSPSKKRAGSVISISDDEEELDFQVSPSKKKALNGHILDERRPENSGLVERDEQLARDLSRTWAKEAESQKVDKGKKRATSQLSNDEDGIEAVEAPYSTSPGINGSSSSTHQLPPGPSSPTKAKPKAMKGTNGDGPLAPLFAKSEPEPDIKPYPGVKAEASTPMRELEDAKPDIKSAFPKPYGAITSTSGETVEPIDFDVDAFTFRPEEVDLCKWPKGRLPYSVLVGVYVQVSSTRSRLMIVRVLTKYARYRILCVLC